VHLRLRHQRYGQLQRAPPIIRRRRVWSWLWQLAPNSAFYSTGAWHQHQQRQSAPAKPPRSTDIPSDLAPRPFQSREPAYYDGLTLLTAQEQAIQQWELPKRPEYGTIAKRIRTFYRETARWDPEGKPSVGSIAAVGFYYDGGLTIIII